MSGSVKLGLILLASVFAVVIALKVVAVVVSLVVPIALLLGAAFVIYVFVSRKALSGGRRTLP